MVIAGAPGRCYIRHPTAGVTNNHLRLIYGTLCFSGQTNGHPIRLQVHRNVGDHQLQRGRTARRHTDANPVKTRTTAGARAVVRVYTQTVQVTVVQLRADVQKVPGLQDVHQPPGQRIAEQSLGQRLKVQIVRKPARALNRCFFFFLFLRNPDTITNHHCRYWLKDNIFNNQKKIINELCALYRSSNGRFPKKTKQTAGRQITLLYWLYWPP